MIGGQHDRETGLFSRFEHATDLAIQHLDRGDDRVAHRGVTDHIAIGEIDHDEFVLSAMQTVDNRVGNLRRTHFRF